MLWIILFDEPRDLQPLCFSDGGDAADGWRSGAGGERVCHGRLQPGARSVRVPESAADAWVEVYFPGYGWIEF